ncbi:hypothetical protein R5H30_01555 [Sulfitobacter sp. D35]|uniref:hypothetical protein n=1 Tax=Sulfitobacter sp. D35 TaxID=3083252 RepID=UPI00296EEFB6|nr:hypothetical protein [Sulfitobacter sp. D35]MDW4496651.1 hypothetical protein [Sulfitobacter sp. D35]
MGRAAYDMTGRVDVTRPMQGGASPLSRIETAMTGLPRSFGVERSVKLSSNRASIGRRLYSIPMAALGPDPRDGLKRFLDSLGAPAAAHRLLTPFAGAAAHLHAGAEEGGRDDVVKVYLEFSTPPPRDADLVFLAAKWNADGDCLRSDYRARDAACLPDLLREVADAAVRESLLALAKHAATRTGAPAVLAVDDHGTPRRSVDVNFYDANLTLADVADIVTDLFEVLGPGAAEADKFLATHGDRVIGHVAAGCGRDGARFATIHFGAEEGP